MAPVSPTDASVTAVPAMIWFAPAKTTIAPKSVATTAPATTASASPSHGPAGQHRPLETEIDHPGTLGHRFSQRREEKWRRDAYRRGKESRERRSLEHVDHGAGADSSAAGARTAARRDAASARRTATITAASTT
jgi:hypothetical protein